MRVVTAIVLILLCTVIIAPWASAEETLVIQLNHSTVLTLRNIERVIIAAPEIADVNVITRNELMIIAKRIGDTTLSVWDARGFTTYVVTVVSAPVPEIRKAVTEALREANVQVRILGEVVILEGSVKTEADKVRAESIASVFGKRVVNLLTVEEPPTPTAQVVEAQLRDALKEWPVVVKALKDDTVLIEGSVATQNDLTRLEAIAKAIVKNVVLLIRIREPLQIRVDTFIAEVDRTALRALGVEWGGGDITHLLTDPFAFHFGNLGQAYPTTPLQLLVTRLHLLEQEGAAKVLANPRLVVQEGKPAKLLVGGEVPIPVLGLDRTVSILFKEFGVRLEFKTVVESGNLLTMDLKTEVSSLDFANAIIASGFTIPTIKSRRVETVLSMHPDQFLLLGGLIQREENQTVQKIPVLGDIPILGALFRSVKFQRGETELVIFVSPTMVTPSKEQPKLPETSP